MILLREGFSLPWTHSYFSSSSSSSSSSSIGTTAHCGLWPVEQCPSIFPICHQLSPSSHSQHLKISFYLLFPSFPGSSPSSRHEPTKSQLLTAHLWSFYFTYPSRLQLHGRGSSSLFCTYEIFFCSDRLTFFPCFCGQPFRITCTSSPIFVDNYSEF